MLQLPRGRNDRVLVRVLVGVQISDFTTSDGVRLSYRTWEGSGRGVVFVHGLASNSQLWGQVAEGLSLFGLKSVAIDQRGHGLSAKTDTGFDYERLTQDLRELLELLLVIDLGWNQPVLVGQSWGCSVVEEFAKRYPDLISGLVLVDGGFSVMGRTFATWEECAQQLAPPRIQGARWKDVEAMIRNSHPDWPERGVEATLANLEKGADGSVKARLEFDSHMTILRNLWEHNPVVTAKEIAVPVVFITALNNTMGGVEAKRADVAEVQSALGSPTTDYWIEGHHDLHAQHPERLREIILSEITEGILK